MTYRGDDEPILSVRPDEPLITQSGRDLLDTIAPEPKADSQELPRRSAIGRRDAYRDRVRAVEQEMWVRSLLRASMVARSFVVPIGNDVAYSRGWESVRSHIEAELRALAEGRLSRHDRGGR